jgi:DNA repair protein RecO (recombination protein O)
MRVEDQPAYVLHARPWRETSLIVDMLTRDHGRVSVVARGVSGPKRHAQRAALQPLQSVRMDYLPRGELARLVAAEAVEAAPRLSGDALMGAFYVNELLLRLCPRQEPQRRLWELYGPLRHDLAGSVSLAWTLRRFERDLLDALGFGLPWDIDAAGERLDPDGDYRLYPELGPVPAARGARDAAPGAAWIALAADALPAPDLLAALRPGLRAVLAAHLGPQPLRSWGLMGELARVRARGG